MGLEVLNPLIRLLPEVEPPARAPPLNEKIMWTLAALIIFFTMYHIYPVGVIQVKGEFEFLQMIMASKIGSLITAGIGPIVLASIFLQLFVGAKIIDIDLSQPEQKKLFHGTQKLLAILLCFFESGVYVFSHAVPVFGYPNPVTGTVVPPLFGDLTLTMIFVTIQMATGSLILLYLDEIVSKYGIGSGISLFIAGGVSLSVVQGTLSLLIPNAVKLLQAGGANAIGNAALVFLPLFFTAVVFLMCAYAEGMKVEIPLAFERARGFGGRFPIKFLYVSNIPVILASALMLNLRMWSTSIGKMAFYVGDVNVMSYIAVVDNSGRLVDGLMFLITPNFPNPVFIGYGAYLEVITSSVTPVFGIPFYLHLLVYAIFMVLLCIVFGSFWIETTGMGPKEVAQQLQKSGLQIPGFRRDPRVVEKVLEKYIPTITILGSAFVGFLAVIADLTGALGTGTGILLTVGILHRMYDDLQAQRLFDLYPDLKNVVG